MSSCTLVPLGSRLGVLVPGRPVAQDVQMPTESRSELACVPVQFGVTAAAECAILSRFLDGAAQLQLPLLGPVRAALGEQRAPECCRDAGYRDHHCPQRP